MSLPTVAAARKAVPIATGFIDYFPDAIAAVAHLSKVGNDQHNPGQPLFWDRSKSQDESDALMRHFLERGTSDTDGIRHSAKVAWRALALLQKEIEADLAKEQSPTFGSIDPLFSPAAVAAINRDFARAYKATSYPYGARTVEEIEAYIARLNDRDED